MSKWITYQDANGNYRVRDEDTNRAIGLVYEEKDAHLIASTSELLDALKIALERMRDVEDGRPHNFTPACSAAIAWAEAIIAKVEAK